MNRWLLIAAETTGRLRDESAHARPGLGYGLSLWLRPGKSIQPVGQSKAADRTRCGSLRGRRRMPPSTLSGGFMRGGDVVIEIIEVEIDSIARDPGFELVQNVLAFV